SSAHRYSSTPPPTSAPSTPSLHDALPILQDPLAFTELQLTFENPLDRVIEGQFKIVLPPGAAVSRFAMKLDLELPLDHPVERVRSEEHTSELQSRSDLVCRLLLEKKKTTK